MIRLHTFGERFSDAAERAPSAEPSWERAVTALPEDQTVIAYDEDQRQIRIGDGVVAGVAPEVWDYTISGWPVVRRWLEHRTAQGRGRGRRTSELDDIRPTGWSDAWNDELLDLLRALIAFCELRPDQDDLLGRICDGPLIAAASLPLPEEDERAVAATERPEHSDQLSNDL